MFPYLVNTEIYSEDSEHLFFSFGIEIESCVLKDEVDALDTSHLHSLYFCSNKK